MPDPLYSGRYAQAFTITPSDSAPIAAPNNQVGCSGILALTSGNVTARFQETNTAVTFPVVAGVVYPFALRFVLSTSTATLLGLK